MQAHFQVNKIIFDYFSFTIKDITPEEMISLLGFDGITFQLTFGLHGYRSRYMYDGVSIYWDENRPEVWAEMTGQGCRVYESYGNGDWFYLCHMVNINENAQMTRVDIAYDDFNGLLDLVTIRQDVENLSWVSRAKTIKITNDYRLNDGNIGSTVMIGDRSSNISCRIYDKAQERNRADEVEHWVRCELQIRHKHADNFILYLMSDIETIYGTEIDNNRRLDCLYFAVLNHFIRFIDVNANDDTNRWRKPCAEHWQKFIDSYKGQSISLYKSPGVEYNELRLRHTAEEMYGGLIYTYIQLFGVDELEQNIDKKKYKLNKKYEYLIHQHTVSEAEKVSFDSGVAESKETFGVLTGGQD